VWSSDRIKQPLQKVCPVDGVQRVSGDWTTTLSHECDRERILTTRRRDGLEQKLYAERTFEVVLWQAAIRAILLFAGAV
jgi:hypothetical protein